MLKPKVKIQIDKNVIKEKVKALQIGANVWHLRNAKKISQQELAQKANTTQNIISKIEDGSYNIGSDLLVKIADALGVNEATLLVKEIDWEANEILDVILKKAKIKNKEYLDILSIMKLFYFIDLKYKEYKGILLRNTQYIRYKAGPYDDGLYKILNNQYNALFYTQINKLKGDGTEYLKFKLKENGIKKYMLLNKEEINFINNVLDRYIDLNSIELRNLSYETTPLKEIKATFGGNEHMGEVILENK